MKKIYSILLFFFLISDSHSLPNGYNWERFSGTWNINNSTANETRGGAITWNYYHLLNYNTIISSESFQNYNYITIDTNIVEKIESPAEFMISFAVSSESKSWYYKIYAFNFTGGFWGINKASFIYSDRLDKTKPLGSKNNTLVNELASSKCSIKYNKNYNYRISFEGKNVVLYINNEKILSAPFPEKSHEGRIAISSRNVKIAVDKVEVKQGDKVIFFDDFNTDTIYVKKLKASREIIPKTDEEKKPE